MSEEKIGQFGKKNFSFGEILGKPVGPIFKKFFVLLKKNRKVLFISLAVGIIFLIGVGWGVYQGIRFWQKSFSTKISFGPYVPGRERSKLVPRRLDGVKVERKEANRFPYAVMIENMVTVRPQKGLSKAGVVYEMLAEGGITRFMAVFSADEKVEDIWPVRSARHYYLEVSSEYNALYVHCGGSPQAYETISNFKIPVLNEISADAKYFWRGPEGMPHNLHTSSKLINKAIVDKKYEERMPPKYESWKFKDEAKEDERGENDKSLKVGFYGDYSVEFKYDRKSNTYLRFNGGVAHLDGATGKQLAPKNVVVQRIPPVVYLNDEKGRIDLDLTGRGEVLVLRDGKVIKGTWQKKDRLSRTKFFDKKNQEIQLNRGQTWIVVVPGEIKVELL